MGRVDWKACAPCYSPIIDLTTQGYHRVDVFENGGVESLCFLLAPDGSSSEFLQEAERQQKVCASLLLRSSAAPSEDLRTVWERQARKGKVAHSLTSKSTAIRSLYRLVLVNAISLCFNFLMSRISSTPPFKLPIRWLVVFASLPIQFNSI